MAGQNMEQRLRSWSKTLHQSIPEQQSPSPRYSGGHRICVLKACLLDQC